MKKMILIMGLTALGLTTLLTEPAQAYRVADQQGRQEWICPRAPGGDPVRCGFFMAGHDRGWMQTLRFRMCGDGRPTPAERPRFGRMHHHPGPDDNGMRYNCPWR